MKMTGHSQLVLSLFFVLFFLVTRLHASYSAAIITLDKTHFILPDVYNLSTAIDLCWDKYEGYLSLPVNTDELSIMIRINQLITSDTHVGYSEDNFWINAALSQTIGKWTTRRGDIVERLSFVWWYAGHPVSGINFGSSSANGFWYSRRGTSRLVAVCETATFSRSIDVPQTTEPTTATTPTAAGTAATAATTTPPTSTATTEMPTSWSSSVHLQFRSLTILKGEVASYREYSLTSISSEHCMIKCVRDVNCIGLSFQTGDSCLLLETNATDLSIISGSGISTTIPTFEDVLLLF